METRSRSVGFLGSAAWDEDPLEGGRAGAGATFLYVRGGTWSRAMVGWMGPQV